MPSGRPTHRSCSVAGKLACAAFHAYLKTASLWDDGTIKNDIMQLIDDISDLLQRMPPTPETDILKRAIARPIRLIEAMTPISVPISPSRALGANLGPHDLPWPVFESQRAQFSTPTRTSAILWPPLISPGI